MLFFLELVLGVVLSLMDALVKVTDVLYIKKL